MSQFLTAYCMSLNFLQTYYLFSCFIFSFTLSLSMLVMRNKFCGNELSRLEIKLLIAKFYYISYRIFHFHTFTCKGKTKQMSIRNDGPNSLYFYFGHIGEHLTVFTIQKQSSYIGIHQCNDRFLGYSPVFIME